MNDDFDAIRGILFATVVVLSVLALVWFAAMYPA